MIPMVMAQQSRRRRILQDLSGFGYSDKTHPRNETTGPLYIVDLDVIPASIMSEEDAMDHPQPMKSFSRRGGQVMIGRASRSSGELPTKENGWYRNAVMSRRHAILRWGQAGVSIQDKDSTHGTRVYRNGQTITCREQPILLRDGDEIQFGKTVNRVEGKSDTITACHNPLRVHVHITQPAEIPVVQIKPEPISPEKPSKFMSHTFSFSAGGESDEDERSVLKNALLLDTEENTIKAPSSKSTASTAEKSDMSISENDDEDEEHQFTFSSPPLPESTAGKPAASQYKKRVMPASSDNEEEEEDDDGENAKDNDEDEEMEDSDPEDDPFTTSRPSSPDATLKSTDIAASIEDEEEEDERSQNSSSDTQETTEENEDHSSQSVDAEMIVEKKETGSASQTSVNGEGAIKKAVDGESEATEKPGEAINNAPPASLPRESSQTILSGRTIHLFEPHFLPKASPTATSTGTSVSIVVPDSQEVASAGPPALSPSNLTQSTLIDFFKTRRDAAKPATINKVNPQINSDEESQSDTSRGSTSPSPPHYQPEVPIASIQVIGKRKRDDESLVDASIEVAFEPVKPIKKARRGFSLKSAVSHTVSLAAGAVMAVALLSVMPELDA